MQVWAFSLFENDDDDDDCDDDVDEVLCYFCKSFAIFQPLYQHHHNLPYGRLPARVFSVFVQQLLSIHRPVFK